MKRSISVPELQQKLALIGFQALSDLLFAVHWIIIIF